MFKIDYDIENNIYTVSQAGVVIESFGSLFDALDYKAAMIWERDNAFNDYGSEYDIETY